MDNLTLAQKIFANQKPKEEVVNKEESTGASIIYMVAVTSSSGGEVVLKNETESTTEWEEGDYLEIDNDGDFNEYEIEDSLEDTGDGVIDLTDGDGADIEGDDGDTIAFTIAEYKTKAIQAYTAEMSVEEDLLEDNLEISDEIDDGDAEEIPEEDAEEDPTEDGEITELDDEEYSLIDANEDDESDVIEGAETSDGYTVAECIGAVNEGDRVAVAVQNGKLIVLGVVGSGDQQRAMTDESQRTADEALEDAEKAKELVKVAETAAEEATEKAALAESSVNQAIQDAQDAKTAATNAEEKANSVAESAQAAIDIANTAKSEAESASGVASAAKADAANALEEARNAAADVVKFESAIAADYTKKTELASVKANFETRITQNANDISSYAKKITEVDETANNAKELADGASAKAEEAKTKADLADADAKEAKFAADTAQQAANDAQDKATTAQQAANDAKSAADTAEEKLAEAKAELEEVQGRVDATEQELADAQEKVDSAQTAADNARIDAANAQLVADAARSDAAKAQTAADNAQSDAEDAQTAADAAKQAADKAQADADALAKRVTTAESDIKQNADNIALAVKKTELTTALGGYYTKTETESLIKSESDSITLKVNAETSAREIDTAALQASLALKVNTKDLISEINASADVITIDSNRLIVNSDNFKLSEDGTLEAVNGKFKGTITGSSGEFTKGFKVKVLDWMGSPFLCEVRSGTEEENSKFIIEYQSQETSALSQLIIQDGTVNMYASTNVNIESDKYVDIYGVFGITVRTRELTIDNVGTNTRWAKFNEDGTYLYGNVKVDSGTLTVNDTEVSLDGHTHNSLYNTVLDESIKFVADGDYGFFRPTTASLVYCGSSARPWYKVYTERLEVLSARPILQPVYDNTVSYATNCYISSAGLLSRTTNTSSRAIKHDVKSITGAEIDPEKLYDITVYQFKYNEDILTDKSDTRYGKDLPGFIIEELVEQYPIAVDRPTDNVREWSWNAQYLIPGMLKLIQDQHKADHKMEQEIATQKARIEQLTYQAQQLFDKVARQQAIIDGLA